MKRNLIKISLDCIMAVILVLLYNSHVLALAFHEIAGLFIFGLFVIHVLLNRKWVISITSKLFNKKLAPQVRFGYAIDILLLIAFVMIIVSGILISQVLFPSLAMGKDSPWRNIHLFSAAVALILVGIHLGLHWNFVSGVFKKVVKLPARVAKPLGIVLLVVVLVFGLYSLKTSSFTTWLTAPFTTSGAKVETGDGDHTAKSGENKGELISGAVFHQGHRLPRLKKKAKPMAGQMQGPMITALKQAKINPPMTRRYSQTAV